jgi:sensor histidine kinase regulating citrate/malate metabolism
MHGWGIARRLLLVFCVVTALITVVVSTAAFVDARDRGYTVMASRMLSVAVAIAESPLVVTAVQSSDPTAALQAYTLAVSERAHVDVISITSPTGVRWTFPDAAKIGQRESDPPRAASTGIPFTEVTSGSGIPMVRAAVPVLKPDGTVVGFVVAGVETDTVQTILDARLPAILALAIALLLGGAGTIWLLDRHLRRLTLGWGPERLTRHVLNTDSVLQSARDGLMLLDRGGALVLYNDQAARLLGLPPRPGARAGSSPPAIEDLELPVSLVGLLSSGRSAVEEVHITASRILSVSQEPALPAYGRSRSRNVPLGTVVILRDPLESLGSDAALVLGALLVGKLARVRESGARVRVETGGDLAEAGVPVQDLVAPLGDLLDDALAAAWVGDAPRRVRVGIRTDARATAVVLEVSVSGSRGSARAVTVPRPTATGSHDVATESGTGSRTGTG